MLYKFIDLGRGLLLMLHFMVMSLPLQQWVCVLSYLSSECKFMKVLLFYNYFFCLIDIEEEHAAMRTCSTMIMV